MQFSKKNQKLIIISGLILLFLLIIFSISDLIYGISLTATKVFYREFSFLSITPLASAKADILMNGMYNNFNLTSFLNLIKNIFISLDIEFVLILILLALLYLYINLSKKFNKYINSIRTVLYFYIVIYFIYTLTASVFLLINSFSIKELSWLAENLGLVITVFSLIKLAAVTYILVVIIAAINQNSGKSFKEEVF